jgi:uncharacterized membrane protein YhaH (DUF805 family)
MDFQKFYFSAKGRANRKQLWLWLMLPVFAVYIVLVILDAALGTQFHPRGGLGHCQSKFGYFAKTSEPDFAAIDFPGFFRVDLSGSMAATSI